MRRRRITNVVLRCFGEDRKEWTWSGYFWGTPTPDELIAAIELTKQNYSPPGHEIRIPFEYVLRVAKLWDGRMTGDTTNLYFAGYHRVGEVKINVSSSYLYEHESIDVKTQ